MRKTPGINQAIELLQKSRTVRYARSLVFISDDLTIIPVNYESMLKKLGQFGILENEMGEEFVRYAQTVAGFYRYNQEVDEIDIPLKYKYLPVSNSIVRHRDKYGIFDLQKIIPITRFFYKLTYPGKVTEDKIKLAIGDIDVEGSLIMFRGAIGEVVSFYVKAKS